MKYIGLFIVGLIAIVGLILLFKRLRSRKSSGRNVIKFEKINNKQVTQQKCTYCKKVGKITFYASNNGTVVGVCKACKVKVNSEDMLPV